MGPRPVGKLQDRLSRRAVSNDRRILTAHDAAAPAALSAHDPYVVCDTGYLAGVLDAARSGLGVALVAGPGGPLDGLIARPDLPPVAPVTLSVRSRRAADPAFAATVATALRATLGRPVG